MPLKYPQYVLPRDREPTQKEKDAAFSETTVVKTRVGFLLSLATAIAVVVLGWAGINQRMEAEAEARKELAKAHAETAERVKVLEHAMIDVATLKNDVGWIRDRMAEERQQRKP